MARHAAPTGPRFYRDLGIVLAGIVVVAAIVYLGLWALSSDGGPPTTGTIAAPASTTSSTSTTAATTLATTTTSSTTATTTTTTAPTTTTTIPLRSPADVVVQVLNGAGIAGIAAEVTSDLSESGYQTLEPGNYQPLLPQSRVWYAEGFEGEATELAVRFPDALVEVATADLEDADIWVVLGQSFEP